MQIILNYLCEAHYDLQCLSEQFVYLYIILNGEKCLCSVTSMAFSNSEIADPYLQQVQYVAVKLIE
jgi:hypothetical protein